MKKLIREIRLRLACWHIKRFNKLMAKALGGKRYYRYSKTMANSLYGMFLTEMPDLYKKFHSGETYMDMSSLYPKITRTEKFSYKDTDSVKG